MALNLLGTHRRFLLISFALVVLISLFAIASQFASHFIRHDTTLVPFQATYTKYVGFWSNHILLFGPERSLSDFASSYAATHSLNRHYAYHGFGEALYQSGGMPYLSYCPTGEIGGCMHGFYYSHLHKTGMQLQDLIDFCEKLSEIQLQSCLHAAGHLFISSQNESLNLKSLNFALSKCDTASHDTLSVCKRGAFMQYVFETATGSSTTKSLLESICSNVDRQDAPSCTYSSLLYIASRFAFKSPQQIISLTQEAHKDCMDIMGDIPNGSQFCAIGIGHGITALKVPPSLVGLACSNISKSLDSRSACLTETIRVYKTLHTTPMDDLCDLVDIDLKRSCDD